MHAISTGGDGGLPVVVDEEQGLRAADGFNSDAHLTLNRALIVGLEAQLHRGNTGASHARDPGRIRQHRIQPQFLRAGGKRDWCGPGVQSEVCRLVGPDCRVKLSGALEQALPGLGHAFCVGLNEAQRQAGLFGHAVNGLRAAENDGALSANGQSQVLMGRNDGLHPGVVWVHALEMLRPDARKVCPAPAYLAEPRVVRPSCHSSKRRGPPGWQRQTRPPW